MLKTSEALLQIAAHSTSSFMHFASICMFCSLRHSVAQSVHSTAQLSHALMHDFMFSFIMAIVFWFGSLTNGRMKIFMELVKKTKQFGIGKKKRLQNCSLLKVCTKEFNCSYLHSNRTLIQKRTMPMLLFLMQILCRRLFLTSGKNQELVYLKIQPNGHTTCHI